MLEHRHSVCVVDDDDFLRESIRDLLAADGYETQAFDSAEAFLEADPDASCLVLDVNMPGLDGLELQRKLNENNRRVAIIFVTAHGDVPSSVRAIKAGALEYFQKPFEPNALLQAVGRAVQLSSMATRSDKLDDASLGIIGSSRRLRRVLEEVEVVAKTDATVLLHGETGTGKELFAQAIHVLSGRTGPLVRVNCAAVPANLLESELMGHEKGAFTGAQSRRIGRFEAAHEGTIFLDEIGELPLDLQAKILRLLQEKAFERLGSNQTIKSTARVVAASNRNLRSMVAERTFREDLFYRLNVFSINLPTLRGRAEDIPVLANHFAELFAGRMNKRVPTIPTEFMERLCAYSWPGNVRELMNVMERASILARGGVLSVQSLSTLSNEDTAPEPPKAPTKVSVPAREPSANDRLDEVDRRHILSVLEATNWIVGGPRGAAVRLGIKRPTLIFRMKKLGIERGTKN
jgi:DNA-binding NtrC family response regulator